MTAGSYADAISERTPVVREEAGDLLLASEAEIQARWFRGDFGSRWTSESGVAVEVTDFGRWNREAGPDFTDVRIRLPDGSVKIGPVEIDRDPRDWDSHGHAANPAFRDTLVHIFLRRPSTRFFTRTCDHRNVEQVYLAPTVPAPVGTAPGDFRPVTEDPSHARAILLAAARHRAAIKGRALSRHAEVRGFDEALFSALAVALGYKRNEIPFLLLTQRAGLTGSRMPGGESLLFGLAGFLESPEPPGASPETRRYLRRLWEDWWRLRTGYLRWILPPGTWAFGGCRPSNHPHRRTAALAAIAARWPGIRAAMAEGSGAFRSALKDLAHPFWNLRCNLNADPLPKFQSLLGPERIADILINVWHPLALERDPASWESFLRLRGPAPAAVIRETARRFFGAAVDDRLGFAAVQQGLLQLRKDECASADPRTFREAVARVSSGRSTTAPRSA